MIYYQIVGWDEHYEKADFKKCKLARWVPIPNKHDGLGFRRLITGADGMACFAAWILILQIASKCPNRGVLIDGDGNPLGPDDMALKTGGDVQIFERALCILTNPKVNWIAKIEVDPDDIRTASGRHPERIRGHPDYRTGQDRT